MKCEVCRGACCESFSLPVGDVFPPSDDARRWITLHASELTSERMTFECACLALSDGRCALYSSRPDVCRDFPAGGPDCLDTVRRRRTPAQYARIREDGDPARIHPEGTTMRPVVWG